MSAMTTFVIGAPVAAKILDSDRPCHLDGRAPEDARCRKVAVIVPASSGSASKPNVQTGRERVIVRLERPNQLVSGPMQLLD